MSTESLIVELDAKTQKMDTKLKATEKRLDELDSTVKKTDTSLGKMSKVAGGVATALVKTTTAAVALGAAIGAIVLSTASSRKELEQFARQAKTTEENFQALAFATKQYGINAEQIADISKDVSDKVSEFAIAGTGAFQDYADSIKLTKEEAREAAIEFTKMSSEEVIGKMVSEMEKAGLSATDMTFALESIGNDLSKLQPLLANNSAELKTMKDRFDSVNSTLQVTAGQAEKLKEVSTSFDLLTGSLGNSATAISATLAPVLNTFINDIIDIVPNATQTIIDFTNSFLAAEDISSKTGVLQQLKESGERILALNHKLEDSRLRGRSYVIADLKDEEARSAALQVQLELLKDQETLADAKRQKGGEIGGEGGKPLGGGTGEQIQAIADRFKDEELLLLEKLERELEIIGENDQLKIELHDEYLMNIIALDEAAEKERGKIQKSADKNKLKSDLTRQKTEQSLEQKNIGSLMSITSALLGHDSKVGKALFLGSQALAASETFVNTQAASIKALTIDPTGILSAKVNLAGNLSLAAIAATTYGSLSGGSSAPSIDSSPISTPSQASTNSSSSQEEFSTLEVTEQSEAGVQEIRLTISDESGNLYLDGLASGLEERTRVGR